MGNITYLIKYFDIHSLRVKEDEKIVSFGHPPNDVDNHLELSFGEFLERFGNSSKILEVSVNAKNKTIEYSEELKTLLSDNRNLHWELFRLYNLKGNKLRELKFYLRGSRWFVPYLYLSLPKPL